MKNRFVCSNCAIFINPVLSKHYFSDQVSEIDNIVSIPTNPYNYVYESLDIHNLKMYVNKNKKVHIFISTSIILGDNMVDMLSELQRLEVKKIIIHIPANRKSLLNIINNDIKRVKELSVKILLKLEHFRRPIEFWVREIWMYHPWRCIDEYRYITYDFNKNMFIISNVKYNFKERRIFVNSIEKRSGNNE